MSQVMFPEDVRINGTLSARTISLPDATVRNENVIASAGIAATKLQHQHALAYAQADGADVVSESKAVHHFRAAGEIVAVEVVPIVAPTGGDKEFTVDVQKGNAGSAFATILTGVVTVDSGSANRTGQAATVDTSAAADGDTLRVVVAASGSTGSQGQGVLVVVTVREEA